MADLIAHAASTPAHGASSRPMLSALTNWWRRAPQASEPEAMLGYESAHPWALDEDVAVPTATETVR